MHNFAAYHTPFQVRTAGLGIFTGPQPVLYIPVIRSPELTQFHQALWQRISGVGDGIQAYYHPNQWMPHITIGFGDMSSEKLSQIVRYLGERDFHWEITVDNLALIKNLSGYPPHVLTRRTPVPRGKKAARRQENP